jgi:PAS domain S-box-containing protein
MDRRDVQNDPGAEAELRRLEALDGYGILDTPAEPEFDDLANLAAALCDAPLAAISLVAQARQWFKAEVGLGVRETPRDVSLCTHAIQTPEIMVVPDATQDPRFAANPLVTGAPGLRFYAGAVVRTAQGEALGTVCVMDTRPRPDGLTPTQARLLLGIARQVVAHLELRRALVSARESRAERRSADAKLQAALDAQLIGVWTWDLHTGLVHADAAFAALYGVDPEIAVGGAPAEAFLAGVAEIDRPAFTAAVRVAIETGEPFSEEYRLKLRPGETQTRWVLARGRTIPGDDGKPDRFSGAVLDITDRKTSEEQARLAAVSLQLALKAGGLGRWDHNPSTGQRFYDERLREIFALAPGEDRDMEAVLAHLHPEDVDTLRERLRLAVDPDRKGGFHETFRVRRPEGGWRWIEASGRSFFEFGRCTRFTGVMRDVSARMAREAEKAETLLRLQLALDAADIGAWVFDPSDETVEWDARTRRILEASPDGPVSFAADFIGRLHPEDQERAATRIAEALQGHLYEDELRVRLRSGEDRWIGVRGRRAAPESLFIGTIRDITADKAMEAQRKLLAEELRHRMKNLLAIVQSIGAQTLRNAATPEDARRIFADRLVALGSALDVLTEQTWSAAPLSQVIDAALAAQDPGAIRVARQGPDVELAAKPALALTLALHELATNALKYGALSTLEGRVRLSWRLYGEGAARRLEIEWCEENGPPVVPPDRRSFGSRLIESNVAQEFGGEARIAFLPSGVVWRLDAPLQAAAAPGPRPL